MSVFNVRRAKHGGIWFISLGRLNFTVSVTSREKYQQREAARRLALEYEITRELEGAILRECCC